MADRSESDFLTLQADLRLLREDFQQLLTDLRTLASHRGAHLGDQVLEPFGEMLEQAGAACDDVRAQIEQRPLQSAAIAVMVGFIAGLAFSRRRT